ncbi:MAG: aspartate kinase [Myxococcota bacterium]
MPVIVQKYGGSSVSSVDKIRRVAERIAATRAEGHDVVVVVSAMGNTTNELLTLAHDASSEPDRRELDMLLSVGERITMALLAMVLCEMGVPARSLTGSQAGVVTDEVSNAARVVEVRPDRLKAVLEGGEVAVVAGFQGVSRAREVTTLGRGGSDTTAVALTAALEADWCEICSDVDGVWSADPRVVARAIKLDEITLEEGLALARGGAKVLYEDAVRYARDHGIEIVAVSSFGPGSGTRLRPSIDRDSDVFAVTSDNQLVAIEVSDATVELEQRLTALGARLRHREGTRWLVDTRNVHGSFVCPEGAVSLGEVARISVVGSRAGERVDVVRRGNTSLRGIPWIRSGGTGDVSWWETHRDDAAAATERLHDAMVRT